MSSSGLVLIADDDSAIRTVLSQALARAGFQTRSTGTCSTLYRWIDERTEYRDDGNPRGGGRRIRVLTEAIRPARTDRSCPKGNVRREGGRRGGGRAAR